MKCIVVDDEKPAREGLADYVSRIDFLELIGTCKSALELSPLLRQQPADLILLDIQMPDLSGIDWLKNTQRPPLVIFTTAYREYAVDGFELDAVDYLLKPISFARFLKACNKALALHTQEQTPSRSEEDPYIFIKVDHQLIRILLQDILYIEAAGDYVFFHTGDGQRHITLLSLKQVEQQLPPRQFLRIHRSYIVNPSQVSALEGNQVLIGENKLPISRGYAEAVYDILVKGRLWKKG